MQGGCSGSGLSGKADGGIRRDDLECAPRCFAHKKRKNFLKFCVCRALRSATNAFLREGFTRKNTAARPVETSRAAMYMKG